MSSHGSSSSSSLASSSSKASSDKALRKYYQAEYPLIGLWVIAGVAAVFAIFNVYRLVQHHRRVRKVAPSLSASSEKNEFSTPPALSPPSAVSRTAQTIKQAYNKSFGWREFSISLWWNVSLTETTWSALYCMAVMILGFLWMPVGKDATPASQAQMIANRCGLIAFAQMPFIVGLAGKNNVLSWFTGISYERLNFLHRSSARACLVLSWVHALGRAVPIGLTGKHSLAHTDMQLGCVALTAYTLLTFISVKPFLRKFAYEAFLISHILLVLIFLISAYFHWPKFGYYIWPSFVIWGFDRLVRVLRVVFLNRLWLSFSSKKNEYAVATVETLHGSCLKVTLPRPYKWTPGQHAYLVCPTISTFPFEAHPFTISSIPLPPTSSNPLTPTVSPMVFLIKVLDGFTARLASQAAENGGTCEIKACVDGPYGIVHSQEAYDNVVLVAGGSGVTYTLPILSGLVESAKAGKSAVRSITFIWVIQNHEHTSWISPQLSSLLASCPSHLNIDIRIHITRPIVHVLPSSTENATSSDSSPRLSIEAGSSSSQDHSDSNELDEKHPSKSMGRKDLGFGTVEEGRPDFGVLLGEVIKSLPGGKTSISVCGPGSLSSSVRSALIKSSSKGGAYRIKDVHEGRVGSVDLHVESFGW